MEPSLIPIDVTPLTLSIEIIGGLCMPIIVHGTPIPFTKSIVISTAFDRQSSIAFHVVQGERPMAADNRTLGRVILDGILPAPRFVPRI